MLKIVRIVNYVDNVTNCSHLDNYVVTQGCIESLKAHENVWGSMKYIWFIYNVAVSWTVFFMFPATLQATLSYPQSKAF